MMVSGSTIGVKERDYRESTPQKKNILRRTQFSQRIREVVPADFFILVNNNRRKLQPRWAPYVNGVYMESGRDFLENRPGGPDGYTFAGDP